ncbi:hypothetical protein VV208B2_01780 [Vibrio vulnificus]|nr:hypothetical protein VV208B2_01780 [Vibrio vulnificus]
MMVILGSVDRKTDERKIGAIMTCLADEKKGILRDRLFPLIGLIGVN